MNLWSGKAKWVFLIGGDIGILYFALWLMLRIRFGDPFQTGAWEQHLAPFTVLYAVWLPIFYVFGLYDLRLAKNNAYFYVALGKALLAAFVIAAIFFYLTSFFGIAPKINLFLVCAFVFLLLAVWRPLYNLFLKYPLSPDQLLMIGQDSKTLELREHLEKNPQLGYRVLEVVEPVPEAFARWVSSSRVHRVITAFPIHAHGEFVKFLFSYANQFSFEPFPSFYERITGRVPLSHIDEVWFLNNLKERERYLYEMAKRMVDVVFGFFIALIMLALFPFIAFAVKLDSSGSLFYSQARVGQHGKLFRLVKFRSMVKDAEHEHALWAQKHDPRITRAGKILRKTFLDELPQCVNILKGEMSLIGPRPERPEFVRQLEQEIPFYQIRHIVKPGITGWAQVHAPYGNSTHGALEKLQYDLYYIKNRSFVLDVKILLKTINIILKGGTQ